MIYVSRPYIREEWAESLKNYLINTSLCDFSERPNLEKKIAEYVNSKYCVAVNSGTSALICALLAVGVKEGDEIIGPNYSNISWVSCCRFLKLKPVLVDVRAKTLCIDPSLLEAAITKKTKVITFVNHASYVGEDLKQVRAICDRHKIVMLEDSCSSFASCIDNKYAGTFGHIGTYSFSIPKTLTSSEGGAIVTSNRKYYEKIKQLRYHGKWFESIRKEYHIGGNFNLSPILAHFLNCQLRDIDFILDKKRSIYNWYKKYKLPFVDFETDNDIGPNVYSYLTKKPKKLEKHLHRKKIQSFYKQYVAIHSYIGVKGSFPVSLELEKRVLMLPGNLHLEENDIKNICEIIYSFESSQKNIFWGRK